MSWDTLLYWLTHQQEGSWITFCRAVTEFASFEHLDVDISYLCRNLRFQLSEASHIDFFIDGSQRWKVRPPILAGLLNCPNTAVLSGGRTPKLLSQMCDVAATLNCQIINDTTSQKIAEIRVRGTEEGIRQIAAIIGIPFVPQQAKCLSQDLNPILKQLEIAEEATPLAGWSAQSFDWQSRKWVDGVLQHTVCEYSYYNTCHYFVHNQQGRLVRMPKYEAIYAVAALRYLQIAVYNKTQRTLATDVSSPLPEMYARIAYFCAGRPSQIAQGQIVYNEISPDLAGLLLVAIGQNHPGLRWVN
ncbi:MAG: hypothetical protein HWQ41_25320 [Nostoc sp. NOS(2021)]|uniref:hypothetical protein n=1 Tax=Nostoc sp. NOS(2021) TaxID=2815407 RepID=UPI0025D8F800|nr:hypothetical protein [Nostoc sp. NOS(2021)]MBN3898467.1 hypothetical protein [Nostoc sp. NOS(2021)]